MTTSDRAELGEAPTAEAMKAVLDRLEPDVRSAMVEVVKAQSWGQVPKGTTERLLDALYAAALAATPTQTGAEGPALREAAKSAASYLEDASDEGTRPYALDLAKRLRSALDPVGLPDPHRLYSPDPATAAEARSELDAYDPRVPRSGAEVAAAPGLDWHQIADDIEGAAHEALLGNAVQDRWFHHEVARIRSDAAARLTAKP